jgi:hypothetical protein
MQTLHHHPTFWWQFWKAFTNILHVFVVSTVTVTTKPKRYFFIFTYHKHNETRPSKGAVTTYDTSQSEWNNSQLHAIKKLKSDTIILQESYKSASFPLCNLPHPTPYSSAAVQAFSCAICVDSIARNVFNFFLLDTVYLFTEDICNGGHIIYDDTHNISTACLQPEGELQECRGEGTYSAQVRQ